MRTLELTGDRESRFGESIEAVTENPNCHGRFDAALQHYPAAFNRL